MKVSNKIAIVFILLLKIIKLIKILALKIPKINNNQVIKNNNNNNSLKLNLVYFKIQYNKFKNIIFLLNIKIIKKYIF